jgi:hypothetical protein
MRVKCRYCKEISDSGEWRIEEGYEEDCELCTGGHEFILFLCPKCGNGDESRPEELYRDTDMTEKEIIQFVHDQLQKSFEQIIGDASTSFSVPLTAENIREQTAQLLNIPVEQVAVNVNGHEFEVLVFRTPTDYVNVELKFDGK